MNLQWLIDQHQRPSLPQSDSGNPRRAEALARDQARYAYDHSLLPGVAMAKDVPGESEPTVRWYATVIETLLKVVTNFGEASLALAAPELKADVREQIKKHSLLADLAQVVRPGGHDDLIGEIVTLLQHGLVTGRPAAVGDYLALFQSIPPPALASTYDENSTFAHLRVAGWNPAVIRRVGAPDERFPVTDQQLQGALGDPGDTLAAAGAEGRLYLTDYQLLSTLKNAECKYGQKYGYAPLGLFALPRGAGRRALRPVAIQPGQDPTAYQIFTPRDGDAWTKARLALDCADFNLHELVSHFARTHALIEPFVLATHRQLAPSHPLRILLMPHFEGTLYINNSAAKVLLGDKGVVAEIFAGTIETAKEVAVAGLKGYPFNGGFLPVELAARGVDKADFEYPYRDDATDVWNAIRDWVSSYLTVYYRSDGDVQQDPELRGWVEELVADTGGKVIGFGEGGRGQIRTLEYLTDAATMIVFTASAQHAAVNFPQRPYLQYAPAVTAAGYEPAPRSIEEANATPVLNLLPPLAQAQTQQQALYILGSIHHTELGQYGRHWFHDERVQPPLAAFQKTLAQVERTIAERNKRRPTPYEFLLPSNIPQSINI